MIKISNFHFRDFLPYLFNQAKNPHVFSKLNLYFYLVLFPIHLITMKFSFTVKSQIFEYYVLNFNYLRQFLKNQLNSVLLIYDLFITIYLYYNHFPKNRLFIHLNYFT